jgi:hypothetical protein
VGYLIASRGDSQFEGPAIGAHGRILSPMPGGASLTGEVQIFDALGEGRYVSLRMRVRRPLGDRLYTALAWEYDWSDFAIESGITSEWSWEIGWRLGHEKD